MTHRQDKRDSPFTSDCHLQNCIRSIASNGGIALSSAWVQALLQEAALAETSAEKHDMSARQLSSHGAAASATQ